MKIDTILSSAHSASAAQPIRSHSDYTVGWISALPLELTAARAMLDHIHPPLPQSPKDENVYTLGAIGKHNVALACLPYGQMGTNSAAVVATRMGLTFPAIRIGLMVGIGGGCPSVYDDIRVGDVVVSKPGTTSGGVIQFDFGRTLGDGTFVRNGSLNAPPNVLLNAIGVVQSAHNLFGNQIKRHLSSFNSIHQRNAYAYQGSENDVLFRSDYLHPLGSYNCHGCCEKSAQIPRQERSDPESPRIHYGTIASGNQVIRNAAVRDRLCAEVGALCIEMEAAGLMNNFPYLLIRGICDYADSHKNKLWQPYAAATAASYAKELLYVVPETSAAAPSIRRIHISQSDTQHPKEDMAIHTPTTFADSIRRSYPSEDTQCQKDTAIQTRTLTYLPFQRNPFFSGREVTFESIERHFRDCGTRQACILQGMGGLGKTQIALEYAYRSVERQCDVFWVNCTTSESIWADFSKIQQMMNAIQSQDVLYEEDDRSMVLRWLESHDNWLLIFDNAEDISFPYGDWMPQNKSHTSARQILFTTRDERLATAIVNFKENIPLMNRGESVELFNISVGRLSGVSTMREDARFALVERLGNLPLAISLAAAYLCENSWLTIDDYLELWQDVSHRPKMFRYERAFSNYNHSILSTWEISFVKVQAVNPQAADTLLVFGLFANKGISFNRLKHASLNIDADVVDFLKDTATLQQSVGLLRSLALISFDGNMISLHPLVHEWIQARLEMRDINVWGLTALRVIYYAWVNDAHPQDGEILGGDWIEHARFALDAISRHSHPLPPVHEECYFVLLVMLVGEGELTDDSRISYREKSLDPNLTDVALPEKSIPGNSIELPTERRNEHSRTSSSFIFTRHAIEPESKSSRATTMLSKFNRASPSTLTIHPTHTKSIERGAVKTKPSNTATFDQPPFIRKLKASTGPLSRLAARFEKSIRPRYSESTELCARMALNLIGLREWWTEHKRTLPSGLEETDRHHLIRLKSFLSLCDLIPMGDAARLDDQYPPHILRVLSKYVIWASTNVGVRIEPAMEEHLRPSKVELQQRAHQIGQHIESES